MQPLAVRCALGMEVKMSDVAIVGGGAAGMMAALIAAERGFSVTLIEKNEKLGKKLYITGKGRCNLTNSCDNEDFFANVVTNPKFMYSSFYGFDSAAVISLFEQLGLKLKIERGNRVFPVSDKSSDVIRTLEKAIRSSGVKVMLNTAVRDLIIDEGAVSALKTVRGVRLDDGNIINSDSVIIATGGLSYPSTGSTGDGYRFARTAGHKICDTYPSLVGVKTKEHYVADMEGLSLKNVTLSAYIDKKCIYSRQGELLFTKDGISGPLVLTLSALHARDIGKKEIRLAIDLKPALDEKMLDARILKDFGEMPNRNFSNAFEKLLPASMNSVIVMLTGIAPGKKINSVTKEERTRIIGLLKAFPLTVTGSNGYNEAVITQGGVDVRQIDPATMVSRLVRNLYFIGEVLDVDALTGGFNLQIAWSTAHAAALALS